MMTKHAYPGAGSRRDRQALLALFAAIGLVGGTEAQAAAAPAPSEASATAQRLWGKLLARCGESYFYAGSPFDSGGMLDSVRMKRTPPLMEFRGVQFNTVAIGITPAERLNGIESRNRVTMVSAAYRERGEAWLNGPSVRLRNTDDILGRSLSNFSGDMADMGMGGAMALELVKAKGSWYAARSSVTRSGSISFGGANFYDVAKLIATPLDHYSCQTGKVIPRPPTPEEAAAIAEAAKKKAEEDRRAAQRAEDDARRLAQERRDKADEAAMLAERDRIEGPWRFEGTRQVFTSRFTSNLIKRAQQYGFNPAEYVDEIAAVNAIIERCMRVTPADWKAADDEQTRRIGMAARGSRLPGPMMIKDQMLGDCDRLSKVRISPPGRAHALTVERSLSTLEGQKFVWRGAFRITVAIQPTEADFEKAGRPTFLTRGAAFNIIDARIPFSASAAVGAP